MSGTEVTIERAPGPMPEEALESSGAKLDPDAPIIEDPDGLADDDAIVSGTPTRFGTGARGCRASSIGREVRGFRAS